MFRKSYHFLGLGRLQLFTKKMINLHEQTDDELSRPDGCSHVMTGCASGSRRAQGCGSQQAEAHQGPIAWYYTGCNAPRRRRLIDITAIIAES